MHKQLTDHHADTAIFGFWVYLMSDCVLFAGLFATYAVLRNNTFGGPSAHELFEMPNVLAETLLLLTSSFTCGLAMLAAHRLAKNETLAWLGATLILGLSFLGMELTEFAKLARDGHTPQSSAFLSSFFTLVATHGIHIACGSIAMLVIMGRLWKKGFTGMTPRRLQTLSLFWHFLDIVWIFIFSFVYLFSAIK
jgi:cytochrome o ubiquinol oxidase subunit III